MTCVNCGLPLREGDAVCSRCGGAVGSAPFPSPPPDIDDTPTIRLPPATATAHRRGGPAIPVLVVSLALLVAIVGVGITLMVRNRSAAASQPDNPVPPAGISTTVSQPNAPILPPMTDSSDPGPSSGESGQAPDETSAKAELDNEVNRDRNAAEAIVGNWVPQLSSKRPGLVANGTTYDYVQIWAEFQQLRSTYPNALLIWSGDYVSYRSPDFYVTIVPQPSPDGASANTWCDDAGLAPADCFAKFLSHEGDSSNTTLLRN